MGTFEETITVEDVRKQALPLGTQVVAGNGMLARPVTWASIVWPESLAAARLPQRGEIVLMTGKATSGAGGAEIVQRASEAQAAAVVLDETPAPATIALANASELPLLMMPAESRIRQVEKAIVSLLVDRKGQLERRGAQIYRQLARISSGNGGMANLIEAMARLTDKSVIIQDKRLRFLHSTVQPRSVAHWEEVESFLMRHDNLPPDLQDRHRVAWINNPVLIQALPIPGLARLVAPVVAGDLGRGTLSLIGPDSELDDIDTLVAEHGAEACALEMSRAKAVSDTEKRLRGTFLERLLIGDVNMQEAIHQGQRFHHDMTASHMAIALTWQGQRTPSVRQLEALVNSVIRSRDRQALVWQREREGEVLIFFVPDTANPIDSGLALAGDCCIQAQRRQHGARVAVGLGQIAKNVGEWRDSYRDARQALELARRLETDIPLYIGDLDVFNLVLSISDRERLIKFCDQNLGVLIEYDHRQHADLVATLEAWFTSLGNLSRTAKALIVHRNTLLYRLGRIEEIAGIDLKRPETRLALHLALTIRRLLKRP